MGDEKQAELSYVYQKNTTQNTIEKVIDWNAQIQSKQLDLSKKKLISLPDKIYDLKHLQFLSLEENEIEVIPEIFSVSLVQLVWLDLRNNNLRSLPTNISKMFHLKNLLLENNKLSSLPLELGYLTSLTGLNLSNNPLLFPPKHVIEIGVKGILKFLQEKLHYQDSAKNCHFDDNDCKDEMMYSSQLVSPDIRESFEDQSLKHFCNDKMVITEKSNKERGLNKQKESHQSNQQTSKKKKNLNDKDCNINSMTHIEKIKFQKEDSLKKIRNNEILSNWRTKKKVKRKEIQTLTPIIKINMPYGNDLPSKCSKNTVSSKKANELLKIEINTNSSQNPIEQQIHEHVKKLKLSNQSAFLLDANEALKRAEDNLNEALNLQKELERNRSLEYRFKAFFT